MLFNLLKPVDVATSAGSVEVAAADLEAGTFVEATFDSVVARGPKTYWRATAFWDGCEQANASQMTCSRYETRYYAVDGAAAPQQQAWDRGLTESAWTSAGAGTFDFPYFGRAAVHKPVLGIRWQRQPTPPPGVPAGATTRSAQGIDAPTIYRETYKSDFQNVVAVTLRVTYYPDKYLPEPDPPPTPYPTATSPRTRDSPIV